MADGPTLDVPNGAVDGSSPPHDLPPGVQWTSSIGNRWTNVDPTSFSSSNGPPTLRARPTVDTSSSGPGDTGFPPTPRTIEGRRRQAIKDGLSRFDFAALCDPHYHGGPDGITTLTIGDIRERGYTSINTDDVVLCFNDIISLHSKVLATWTNPRYEQSGRPLTASLKRLYPPSFPNSRGFRLLSWLCGTTICRRFPLSISYP